jgi:hypothetical protein
MPSWELLQPVKLPCQDQLPTEVQILRILQQGGALQHMVPCDLVACIWFAQQIKAEKDLVKFCFLAYLKVPGAIQRFCDSLPAGPLSGKGLHQALQAAVLPLTCAWILFVSLCSVVLPKHVALSSTAAASCQVKQR